MHFGFDDEQLSVRDTVGALLDKRFDLAALQETWNAGSCAPAMGLWRELAGLGLHGLLAPEAAGGSSLGWTTMALVLAETGRSALPLPVCESAAVAVPALLAARDPGGLLEAVVAGSLVATVVSAPGSIAPASTVSDLFLVAAGNRAPGAFAYRRDEVDLEPLRSVDRTRDLARVTPSGEGMPLGAGEAAATIAELAALGSAAQLIGLGRELVRMTVEYVKRRHQFGVPIGSFQAVKHRLADAHLQMEFAAPAVWAAAYALDSTPPGESNRARAVSMAKAMASDAASGAAKAALQCHGAMGYTDDYHLHFWLKRVWCLAAAHGSAVEHRSKVATELGI